jgi:lipoprotein NlpD
MNLSMRNILAIVVAATLAACAAKRPAPVSDLRLPASTKPAPSEPSASVAPVEVPKTIDLGKVHTIQKGDTLISIALANGLDYREFAAWNNIVNPNVIKLGEVLRLTPPGTVVENSAGLTPSNSGAVATPLIITQVPTAVGASIPNTDRLKTEPRAVTLPYSDQTYAKLSAEAAAASINSAAATPATLVPAPVVVSPPANDDVDWAWPIQPAPKGKIIAMFTDANKGVDISGSKGSSVLASAPGKVVYSGAGLRGYGRLVIIKHNAMWLSAYAHNEKILVAEGEEVKKGQKIAEMGSSDADQVKLHFEIRKQGKPVDPMQFLPK